MASFHFTYRNVRDSAQFELLDAEGKTKYQVWWGRNSVVLIRSSTKDYEGKTRWLVQIAPGHKLWPDDFIQLLGFSIDEAEQKERARRNR